MSDLVPVAAFAWLLAVFCLAPVVLIIVFALYFTRKARQAKIRMYTDWAARYRFHYVPRDDSLVNLSTGAPFGMGNARHCTDVFRGGYKGRQVLFFQHNYSESNGETNTQHSWQVVAVALPAFRPRLDIGLENALSKRFGKDINFENQAFNDIFSIQSPSPRFAYDVIHARTMEWMLADARARRLRWRFEGPWLMTTRSGALKLEEVFFYADFLIDVLAQVPKHVWSDK